MFLMHNSFVLEKVQKNKAIYYEMALYQWQGQKDLVSPAGSVGASEYLLYSEVSTGHPHPSARGFGAKSTLSVKPVSKYIPPKIPHKNSTFRI